MNRQIWDMSPTRAETFDYEQARAEDADNLPCEKCGETAETIQDGLSTGYGYGWGRVCDGCGHVKHMEPFV